MSQTQSRTANRLKRKAQAAERQIASFEKTYGTAHLKLLYQAAFPLALTPDLLYQLWANFQRDTHGQFLNVPWIAVSDILLSSFSQEVGEELYELDSAVRNALLTRLQNDSGFGQQRIQELSDFLLDYIQQQLQSDDVDLRDFAESQRWTALAYTRPDKVAQDLASTFQQLGADTVADADPLNKPAPNKSELVRMAALVKTLSAPLTSAEQQPLLTYAQGMEQWAKGNVQRATKQLSQVTDAGKIQIAGVDLPIPAGTGLEAPTSDGDGQKIGAKQDAQDFSGQRLRGRSFRGQMLAGANFSKADLRGADFSKAILTGANFSGAEMGLRRRWVLVLILPVLLLSVLAGLMAALVGLGGWGVFFGAFSVHATESIGAELVAILIGCSIGFVIFLWLCRVTLTRKLTASLSAGGLACLGAVFFSMAVMLPILGGWDQAASLRLPIRVSAGITVFFAIALAWFVSRSAISRVTVGTATLVTLVLAISSMLGESLFFAVSLSLMTTLLALWLIWLSHQSSRLWSTLLIALLMSLVPGIVTATFIPLSESIENVMLALFMIIFLVPFVGPLMIPFMLAGTLSPRGATAGMLIFLMVLAGGSFIIWAMSLWLGDSSNGLIVVVFAIISVVVAVLGWATAISIAVTLAIVWAESNSKILTLTLPLLGAVQLILSAIVFIFFSSSWIPATELSLFSFVLSIGVGILLTSMVVGLGVYIFWQAIHHNQQFVAVRDLAIAFTARGGTNFYGADLTGANFTAATLKNVNFINAILTNVRWFHAQRLYTAYFSNSSSNGSSNSSYLQSAKAQWLVTSGLGHHQNLDDLNLQGINLQHINLSDASFTGTDLTGANLKEANLSRAKLINTNLDQADFFGACLTGAYVNNITITPQTKLRGIDCQYIFTRLPTPNNPDPHRIPEDHRKIFKPGEFAQLMRQQFLRADEVLPAASKV